MFTLEDNAKVACGFALRGYCPLVNHEVVSLETNATGKEAVQQLIQNTIAYLDDLPDVERLDDAIVMQDRAGFTDVS